MKILVRISIWTLVAIVIQQSVFLYVENVYLTADVKIEAKKVEEKETLKNKNLNEIQIKEGIGEVSVSSDGRFVAYIDGNKLKVFDSNDNSEKEFVSENEGDVVFYKWLTNENSLIVIQQVQKDGILYFEPISFTANKGEARQLTDVNLKEVKINIKNKSDKIDNIVFSNATHSLYIKIKKQTGKSDLYYANVMNQLEQVRSNKDIGNIVVPTTNANAVMEIGKNVTILNSPGNIEIPNVKSTKVLGADINDNVYFGEEKDGEISKIYYTVLNNEKLQWHALNLLKPVGIEDIIVDYSGKVYVNDKFEKNVVELTSKKSVEYEGELVQAYEKGFITRNGNVLIKNEIAANKISIK